MHTVTTSCKNSNPRQNAKGKAKKSSQERSMCWAVAKQPSGQRHTQDWKTAYTAALDHQTERVFPAPEPTPMTALPVT
jgi:hypothetical protein